MDHNKLILHSITAGSPVWIPVCTGWSGINSQLINTELIKASSYEQIHYILADSDGLLFLLTEIQLSFV